MGQQLQKRRTNKERKARWEELIRAQSSEFSFLFSSFQVNNIYDPPLFLKINLISIYMEEYSNRYFSCNFWWCMVSYYHFYSQTVYLGEWNLYHFHSHVSLSILFSNCKKKHWIVCIFRSFFINYLLMMLFLNQVGMIWKKKQQGLMI